VYAAGTAADSSHNPHLVVEVNGSATLVCQGRESITAG
jgi:hypothetical protein